MYFLDVEVLAGENCFLKAAAVGAVALVLDNIEYLVALVAFRHAGDDLKNELRVLQRRLGGDGGVQLLDIFGDDERQLADLAYDLAYPLDVVGLRVIKDGFAHAPHYADLVHCAALLLDAAELFLSQTADGVRRVRDGGEQGAVIRAADVVHGLFKMDRVELALGGADTAADAEILVDDSAAAAEAAGAIQCG